MKQAKAETYWTIPYLTIWGIQWMADSLLQYIWMIDPSGAFRKVLLIAAAAVSAVYLIRDARSYAVKERHWNVKTGVPAVAAAIVLLVIVQLVRLGLIPPLYTELLRSLLLAGFYLYVGVSLNRELVHLAVWLGALTAVIGTWYLGYAPIILGFSGGASLLACATIFTFWGKPGAAPGRH